MEKDWLVRDTCQLGVMLTAGHPQGSFPVRLASREDNRVSSLLPRANWISHPLHRLPFHLAAIQLLSKISFRHRIARKSHLSELCLSSKRIKRSFQLVNWETSNFVYPKTEWIRFMKGTKRIEKTLISRDYEACSVFSVLYLYCDLIIDN